jgi:hypothetical protein
MDMMCAQMKLGCTNFTAGTVTRSTPEASVSATSATFIHRTLKCKENEYVVGMHCPVDQVANNNCISMYLECAAITLHDIGTVGPDDASPPGGGGGKFEYTL